MTAAADKRPQRKEGSNSIRPEPTHVLSATKTVIPTLVSSTISDAATSQQDKQTFGCIIHGHI